MSKIHKPHYSALYRREIERLNQQLRDAREMVTDFRAHLVTPKFQGDGRDYIQTSDVESRLMAIQMALT